MRTFLTSDMEITHLGQLPGRFDVVATLHHLNKNGEYYSIVESSTRALVLTCTSYAPMPNFVLSMVINFVELMCRAEIFCVVLSSSAVSLSFLGSSRWSPRGPSFLGVAGMASICVI